MNTHSANGDPNLRLLVSLCCMTGMTRQSVLGIGKGRWQRLVVDDVKLRRLTRSVDGEVPPPPPAL